MECRICGNGSKNKSYRVREMMYGMREYFDYFQCAKCGCLQIKEAPRELSRYYPSQYYSFTNTSSPDFYRASIVNKQNIDLNNDMKILDVGCGSGGLLLALQYQGFKHLEGIDPNIDQPVIYNNGIKIMKKSILDMEQKYDLIIFRHSFEHLSNPHESLQKVHESLTKNGVCILSMPTVSSYAWRKYREDWVELDAPRHMYVYSMKSIKLLASSHGLMIRSYNYDSASLQFWGSIQYRHDIPLQSERSYQVNAKKSMFSPSQIKWYNMLSTLLNAIGQGGRFTLYLVNK